MARICDVDDDDERGRPATTTNNSCHYWTIIVVARKSLPFLLRRNHCHRLGSGGATNDIRASEPTGRDRMVIVEGTSVSVKCGTSRGVGGGGLLNGIRSVKFCIQDWAPP